LRFLLDTKTEDTKTAILDRQQQEVSRLEQKIYQLETGKATASYVTQIETSLKNLKNVAVLRQVTLYSEPNGVFVHGVFFKDAKIISVMVNNLKSSKLFAHYTQTSSGTVQPNKKELKLKPKSTTEYEFILDTNNENKFVTFEVVPNVGDISITIFYEQKILSS